MGANPVSDSSKKTFYYIVEGNIATKVSEDTPGAIERKNKNDKLVYEHHFGSLTGVITGLRIEENNEYGDRMVIELSDNSPNKMILNVPVESSHFRTFMMKLVNIPEGQVVTLKPYDFTPDDKRKTGLNVFLGYEDSQEKIGNYFTKDEPGEMPVFPEGGSKSDIKKWGIDVTDFLKELLEKEKVRFAQAEKQPVNPPPVREAPEAGDVEDDLPF